MPINQTIWKISNKIEQVQETKVASEAELESVLQTRIDILKENWLIIGRQVPTAYATYIDLLAVDPAGSLIIIELKKDKTPREVAAQGLDYASWIKSLSPEQISDIYKSYDDKYLKEGKSLDKAFSDKFGIKLAEDDLNSSHQIVIVAAELDSSTERIISYLNENKIPINVVFFKVFNVNNEKYISRAWLIDPYETANIATIQKTEEPWNGEFYVSYGDGINRAWLDAKEFGFISGGGGTWYSRTLNQLKVGDRVWVNIPQVGYIGVGKVTDTAKKADEVIFSVGGKEGNIYELSKRAKYHSEFRNDEDKSEYIVRVDWLKTVDIDNAVKEVGFFGNQNTVCKPTTPKWTHTVNRLKEVWDIK